MNNNKLRSIILYVAIFAVIVTVIILKNGIINTNETQVQYSYNDMIAQMVNSEVDTIEIQRDSEVSDSGLAVVHTKKGEIYGVQLPSVSGVMDVVNSLAAQNAIKVKTVAPSKTSSMLSIGATIVTVIIIALLMFVLFQQMRGGGGGGKVMNFGKSRARLHTDADKKYTFADVAGLDEEKAEVEEVVQFLKEPKKFTDLGARIPKGMLMVGPPGTGKTLLAKAIAGEAGVPFFSISGSDFVEMFVGVGASRVRDLFEQAKKNTPCLVFIDEIDAVGRQRGAGLGGGHDEREQTLNQLLVEMDGFGVNEGIIIMAATNRPDILDPALLRPGRFDRQLVVGVPDVKGREAILKVHAKGKKMASDVDLHEVAQTTQGFTGADLENLLNEAALLAARNNQKVITQQNIKDSFIKVALGTEKKSKVITEKERKITAYHEAGHAILFEKLPELSPVHTVSTIPVGRAGGYTMPMPKDQGFEFKKEMEERIVATFGGRVAEELIFGDYTQGASGDIEQASNAARMMVMRYGMSEKLGPILYGDESHDVFLGKDIGHGRNYGEKTATEIDDEIKRIISESYNKAKEILSSDIDALHRTAQLLIEKEKVTGDEFRACLNQVGEFAPVAEINDSVNIESTIEE
ncbi:MAG: ATP-dependent zinc metalloprotease FtsH [Clostridia bacterium]|nr:ATP-dependent zinc metalloprotease FtsH [Clostridia bacterium]